jgi:Uma2 family endonuclease
MRVTAPQVRRWTREEYNKMARAGVFAPDERVELIEGEIVAMAAQRSPQATTVCLAQDALRAAFGPGFYVRTQFPLSLGPDSEPEPDLAVVPGNPRDYAEAHPTMALLAVEVSDETLAFDRGRKARLYARAGIPEYWIVNLVDRVLEVYRDPGPLPGRPSEYGYRSVQRFAPPEAVTPLSPGAGAVRVADLMP